MSIFLTTQRTLGVSFLARRHFNRVQLKTNSPSTAFTSGGKIDTALHIANSDRILDLTGFGFKNCHFLDLNRILK